MNQKASPNTSPGATATSTAPPTASIADEIEQALMNSIAISNDDLEKLAAERAKTVRAYILQTGKVEAERILLAERQPGGVKTGGSKAFLQLR